MSSTEVEKKKKKVSAEDRCEAFKTRDGERCTVKKQEGSQYCARHQTKDPSPVKEDTPKTIATGSGSNSGSRSDRKSKK